MEYKLSCSCFLRTLRGQYFFHETHEVYTKKKYMCIAGACFIFIFLPTVILHSQTPERKSVHELQSTDPPSITPRHSESSTSLQHSSPRRVFDISSKLSATHTTAGSLTKIIFGYHPYWISSSSINNYQFDLLSHVAYFSYEVNPNTGGYNTIRDWLSTPLIPKAHAAGTKVVLCVTNFGSSANTTLLSNPITRDTLIATLIRLVKMRDADGVNIDFESVPSSQRANLVTFFRDLSMRMKAAIPGANISVAAPAVDWNNAWDIAALAQYIDIFFVMCYDYYWSGSDYAGPVAPLRGTNYNVTRSIDWYISQGASLSQVVMGIPYYGYEWPVENETKQAKTTGTASAKTYSTAKQNASSFGRMWDDIFMNPWYRYKTTSWYQCWYDDSVSLAAKYDLALQRNIGGVGMWALGYDGANPELWDLLRAKFITTTNVNAVSAPSDIYLEQNYPNPFSTSTTIRLVIRDWRLESTAHNTLITNLRSLISFKVFDLFGREVLDLSNEASGNSLAESFGQITIHKSQLPAPGIYFYRFTTLTQTQTKPMVMMR